MSRGEGPSAERSGGELPGERAPQRPRLVRKRDGRLVPFDGAKIAEAVRRATAAVGEEDRSFARDVATVVELALARRLLRAGGADLGGDGFGGGGPGRDADVPDIEQIQDHVERALIELGRAPVAKAYILYRDRRARAREALRVRPDPLSTLAPSPAESGSAAHSTAGGSGPVPRGLQVLAADRSAPWSKGRIAAALVAEADLPRETAETVAHRVEARVFDAGLESISTGLIRALVDNELVALGLTAALARHEPVAVPRHDLRRALDSEGARVFLPQVAEEVEGGAVALDSALGGEVLRRFVVREVLDERTRELHLQGDLHLEDLRTPHLYLTLGVPMELALAGGSGDGAFGLLEPLAGMLSSVSRSLTLEDTGLLLGELARSTRARSALGLGAFLRALGALGTAAGRRIDLRSPGPRHGAARTRLLEELLALEPTAHTPRLFLEESELEALGEAGSGARQELSRRVAEGRLVVVFEREDEHFAAPGCRRGPRERGLVACGGAVALHLARLARRAGPWREERLLEELFGLLSCAVEGLRRLQQFQASRPHLRPLPLRPKVGYALVPVGLREALRVLGDGELDPEQGARLLGLMAEAAHRFPGAGAPPIHVSPFFGARAAERFGRLDAEARRREAPQQGLLFAHDPTPAGEGSARAPSLGLHLGPVGRWRAGEAEAELLRTSPSGALWPPLPEGGEEPTPLDRFRAARQRQRRPEFGSLLPLEGTASRLRLLRDREAGAGIERRPADAHVPEPGDGSPVPRETAPALGGAPGDPEG
jgi:hypothetical protein